MTASPEIRRSSRLHRRWVPQKWEPIYEQFVLYSATGMSNEAIGKRFGYTKEHVSNVLCTPQAQVVKEELSHRMRDGLLNTIDDNRTKLLARAHDNIKNVLTSDELLVKSPFKMLDASMKYLQGVGEMKGEDKGDTTNIHISSTVVNNLVMALEKSEQVKELHSAQNGDS